MWREKKGKKKSWARRAMWEMIYDSVEIFIQTNISFFSQTLQSASATESENSWAQLLTSRRRRRRRFVRQFHNIDLHSTSIWILQTFISLAICIFFCSLLHWFRFRGKILSCHEFDRISRRRLPIRAGRSGRSELVYIVVVMTLCSRSKWVFAQFNWKNYVALEILDLCSFLPAPLVFIESWSFGAGSLWLNFSVCVIITFCSLPIVSGDSPNGTRPAKRKKRDRLRMLEKLNTREKVCWKNIDMNWCFFSIFFFFFVRWMPFHV